MVAQLLTRLRRTVDVALHARRHARALAQVRALGQVRDLLLICHGNICRSPFAAAALEAQLGGTGIGVHSAGFLGQGRTPPPHAVTAAAARGVDLTVHRSRLVVPSLLRAADLIVVMESAHRTTLRYDFGVPAHRILLLGDLDPGPPQARGIVDPWDRPLPVFEEVYARIERCITALARLLIEGDAVSRRYTPRARPADQRSSSPAIPRSSTTPGLQSSHANSS